MTSSKRRLPTDLDEEAHDSAFNKQVGQGGYTTQCSKVADNIESFTLSYASGAQCTVQLVQETIQCDGNSGYKPGYTGTSSGHFFKLK